MDYVSVDDLLSIRLSFSHWQLLCVWCRRLIELAWIGSSLWSACICSTCLHPDSKLPTRMNIEWSVMSTNVSIYCVVVNLISTGSLNVQLELGGAEAGHRSGFNKRLVSGIWENAEAFCSFWLSRNTVPRCIYMVYLFLETFMDVPDTSLMMVLKPFVTNFNASMSPCR